LRIGDDDGFNGGSVSQWENELQGAVVSLANLYGVQRTNSRALRELGPLPFRKICHRVKVGYPPLVQPAKNLSGPVAWPSKGCKEASHFGEAEGKKIDQRGHGRLRLTQRRKIRQPSKRRRGIIPR